MRKYARTVTMNIDVDIDMGEFEDSELAEEVNRRKRNKKWDESEIIDSYDLKDDMPLENLDFRMKLEIFLEAWQKYSFTDLKEKLQ